MTQRPLGCKAADPTMTNWEVAPAISISRLVKSFGSTRALDELDLVVKTGEVHGFLGPNGAGKTTTIRVLLGLLTAWGARLAAGTAILLRPEAIANVARSQR